MQTINDMQNIPPLHTKNRKKGTTDYDKYHGF